MGIFRKQKQEAKLQTPAYEGKRNRQKGFWDRLRREKPWLVRGMAVSLIFAIGLSCFYEVFRTRAEKYTESPIESAGNIAWLYTSCYLLYRDLYNSQNEEQLDYINIFLKTREGYQWVLDRNQLQEYRNLLELMEEAESLDEKASESEKQDLQVILQGDAYDNFLNEYVANGLLDEDWRQTYLNSDNLYNLGKQECINLENEIEEVRHFFQGLETNFRSLNSSYDYIIEDHITGKYITNMSPDDRDRDSAEQYFLLSFSFDSTGNVTIGDRMFGENTAQIRKYANEAVRVNPPQSLIGKESDVFSKYGWIRQPVDCTVTFAVSRQAWENRSAVFFVGAQSQDSEYYTVLYLVAPGRNYYSLNAYRFSGVGDIIAVCMLVVFLSGCFLPVLRGTKPWRDERICTFPFEFLCLVGLILYVLIEDILSMVAYIASGKAGGALTVYLSGDRELAELLVGALNLTALTLFFFACWYLGVCTRAVRGLGLKEYIKHRSLTYRFFPFVKGKALNAYRVVAHLDLTEDANRTIIRLLLVNAVVLFIISSLWLGGFAITLVYSLLLYVVLRKYISELQKRYRILLKAVDEIAEGNLNVTINEDLGVFEPFRELVFKIQEGLQKAVDVEVKSQRMRAELITNMSHDLKTPLTAIITYTNLLKEEGVSEEQRKEYLATLERKSLRLKSLIEDLFEFSKANSQNVTLNIMDVDIMNLVKQVSFEMSDKVQEAGLDVRMNLTEERVILPLDSQKTYRIYENLFGNIAKYALQGTRVYVNGFRIDDTVVITLKNISAQEITVDSSELTERFVRGDASRNTEGSGLGLAIAKSFTELQGGELGLEVDGDLFKVTTIWHVGGGMIEENLKVK